MSEWRSPEELLAIGFERSQVVMVNEFHDGMRHCARTREVGRRLLPVAHRCGVRHLAMEALGGPYVEQPDLKALIDDARALGFELVAYEARSERSPFRDDGSVDWEIVNERERGQAENLAAALPATPLLVWCGNSHHAKRPSDDGWTPMGMHFRDLTGIDFFAVDQTYTVMHPELGEELRDDLEPFGGTAGMLREELPDAFAAWDDDAVLFSVDNAVV